MSNGFRPDLELALVPGRDPACRGDRHLTAGQGEREMSLLDRLMSPR
jgi:hypothetical protein